MTEIGLLAYPGAQLAAIYGLTDLFRIASGMCPPGVGFRVTHWSQADLEVEKSFQSGPDTGGPSGGYRLSRQAEEITFLDVVEAVEGPGLTFACTEIRKNNPCRPDDYCEKRSCPIARVMWKADKAWRDSLRSVTLADFGQTLQAEVPEPLLQASFEWFSSRK